MASHNLTPEDNQILIVRQCNEAGYPVYARHPLPQFKDRFWLLFEKLGVSDLPPELFIPEIGLWIRLREPTEEQKEYDTHLERYKILYTDHHREAWELIKQMYEKI